MRREQNILITLFLLCVWGCAATFWVGNKSTTLRLGMSRQQVQALLGPPQQTMAHELNGMLIETWKYLDRTVTFQNGVVQSWNAQP